MTLPRLSTRLVAGDGLRHCVVATWNSDRPVGQQELAAPINGILKLLHDQPELR